ncbi:DNA internalization-related competence protein ComEC/Rec2 [Alkalihalobacillus sp. CinArs1]|uniref:DNA internalization-related competence protein ComEC/Rec2 n=1 Tax=Alkalihalobacillus sp. CinArs1 TaxID=2995314 RepID=UPI0022DCE84B|nr:DNA internalization-related competence protein ComEC/Rec2 [Alkalihalobacillus sp. CinArs1]
MTGITSNESLYPILFLSFLLIWCARKAPRLSIFVLLTFISFYTYAGVSDARNNTHLSGKESSIMGNVHSIPTIDGSKLSFEYKTISNEKLMVVYYISSKREKENLKSLKVGSSCTLSGALEAPLAPGVSSQFNYKKHLQHQHIHWIYELDQFPQCNPSPKSLGTLFQNIRQEILVDIEKHYPDELKGISASLLIGERGLMDPDVEKAYRELGLSHVLAVSGLHVGIVCGLVFWVLIRIGFTRERVYELLFFLCPIYMVIAGAAPSVVRASIMMMFISMILRMKRSPNPLDAISSACVLLLIYDPFVVYHIGFQLSFLITFALIISSKSIFHRYQTPFTQLFIVSLLAQVVSLPLILFHFYEISLLSLPLNILYVPVISVVILPAVFGLAILRLFHLTSIFQVCSAVLSFFVEIIHRVFVWLNQFNFSLIFGSPPMIVLILVFISTYLVLLIWEKKTVIKGMIAWVSVIFVIYMLPYMNPYGTVAFLDVGQGDCIIITLPFQRQTIVIDTGGTPVFGEKERWEQPQSQFDVGADIVVPYLKSKGIRSIDLLLLTHGDFDHVGGTIAILNEISVKHIMLDRSDEQTNTEKEIMQLANKKGSKMLKASEELKWNSGGAFFSIVQALQVKEENDGSIVLYAELGKYRWLFLGDIEEVGEKELLSSNDNIKADILKVGHHGSDSSSSEELIRGVDPKIAVVSAGKDNRYGHPHPDVIARFKELGVKMMRTDESGTITYKFLLGKRGTWHGQRNEK